MPRLPLLIGVWALLAGAPAAAGPTPESGGGLASLASLPDPNDTDFARRLRLKIGGWLNVGVTYNPGQPDDHFNGPVSFGDRANELQLNQLYLFAERKAAKDGWDLGGRLDFVFGSDALFTRSLGDPGDHWDAHVLHDRVYGIALPQIYLEIAAPLGEGLRVKAGEFYTVLGVESVMAPDNFFYSHSYAMQYGEPFSHVGFLASYAPAEDVELKAGAVTFSPLGGWDGGFHLSPGNWSFVGGIDWTLPGKATSVSLAGTHGGWEHSGNREVSLYSLVLRHDFSGKLHGILQHDRGWFTGNAQARRAEWYGLVSYLTYDVAESVTAGLRLEWFRDDAGVRVSTSAREPKSTLPAASYYEATLGATWKPRGWLNLRANCRYDFSDGAQAFDAGRGASQWLLSVDALLTF